MLKVILRNLQKTIICFLLFLLVSLTGCSNKPGTINHLPEISPEGFYEYAWVEPRIIFSDSLMTLIRADRLDSIYMAQPRGQDRKKSPAVLFKIDQPFCFVSINLLDQNGRVSYPLLAQNLASGVYKYSLEVNRLNIVPENTKYLLKCEYCGKTLIQDL